MKQEKKNSRVRLILVMIVLLAALLAAIFLTDPGGEKTESIQAVMKDAVLHEDNQMAFLGMRVNPSVISDWVVTGLLLVVAAANFRNSALQARSRQAAKRTGSAGFVLPGYGEVVQPAPQRVPRRVHIQRGHVHRCRYAL